MIVRPGTRVQRADLEAWVDACASQVGSYEDVVEMLTWVLDDEGLIVTAVGRTVREQAVTLLGVVRQPFSRTNEVPAPVGCVEKRAAIRQHRSEYTA